VFPIAPAFVRDQLDVLLSDVRIDATKIGMVGQAPVIQAVAERLAHWAVTPVVLDPVMVAKSGDPLLDKSAVGALREALLPLANVITRTFRAAAARGAAPETVREMTRAAEKLRRLMRGMARAGCC